MSGVWACRAQKAAKFICAVCFHYLQVFVANKLINAPQNRSSHFFVNLHPQFRPAGTAPEQESLEDGVNINTNIIPRISNAGVIVQLPDAADSSRLLLRSLLHKHFHEINPSIAHSRSLSL